MGQPVAERWNGLFCENFLHDRQKQTGKQQTGDGAALCYNKYSNVPGVLCVPPALRGGRAAAVALVAKQMAERGEAVLPEALLPDYHRLSQAERERAERLAAEAAAQNHQTENGKE